MPQCDQMPKIFAQYLAIYNNANWPKSTLGFPKLIQKFAKYKLNPKKVAKYFYILPNVVKFCQIWSHCRESHSYCLSLSLFHSLSHTFSLSHLATIFPEFFGVFIVSHYFGRADEREVERIEEEDEVFPGIEVA